MGKSHKKKTKKADFQKVKLKVGKKKPKGTNVTDISFRTSAIQIASQLEKGEEPTNKRNLSLKELLTQLNHYNITIRHEALLGMRDLFQVHPEVMHGQVSTWISKVLDRITDTDAAVRHSVHLVLNYALRELQQHEVLPFLKIIIAYICCGMTHINEGVQLDSLNVLELFLDGFPEAFVPFSSKILTHFMDIISKQSSKETSTSQTLKGSKLKGTSSHVSRELSIDVKGRMSNLKTRGKVLDKLYKILKVVQEYQLPKQSTTNYDDGLNDIIVSNNKQTFVRIYKYSVYPPQIQDTELESWLDDTNMENSSTTYDINNIDEFIRNIFPVLLNCWLEYDPGQLASGLIDSNALKSSLPGMKIIVDILEILMEVLLNDTKSNDSRLLLIKEVYFKDFSIHFLHYFALPINFDKSAQVKSIKPGKPDSLQQFAIDFNFVMARIVCSVLLEVSTDDTGQAVVNDKLQTRYLKQLVLFVTQILEHNSMLACEKIDKFLLIIDYMFQLKRKANENNGHLIDISLVLKKMVHCFKRASVSSSWKIPLIKFFTRLLNCEHDNHLLEDSSCSKHILGFIETLVSDVWSLPPTSSLLIKESIIFMKLIMTRGYADDQIKASVQNSMLKMTDCSSGLFVGLPENIQKTLVEVVYTMKAVPCNVIKKLAYICHAGNINITVKKYIISIVGYCMKKQEPSVEVETYINFMISVIIGYSVHALKKFNIEKPNLVSWSVLNIVEDGAKEIPVEHAINQLEQLDGSEKLWLFLVPPIGKLLIMLRIVPVTVALGLIKLLERLCYWHSSSSTPPMPSAVDSEINQVADLLSSVLLYSVSETYISLTRKEPDFKTPDLTVDLLSCSINMIVRNKLLLRLLVKKWINILGEYKMNSDCITSIIEVLVLLLHDSEVQVVMSELKPNLQSIVKAFDHVNTSTKQSSLLQQLKMQVASLQNVASY